MQIRSCSQIDYSKDNIKCKFENITRWTNHFLFLFFFFLLDQPLLGGQMFRLQSWSIKYPTLISIEFFFPWFWWSSWYILLSPFQINIGCVWFSMKVMEFDLEVDQWGHNLYGGGEESIKNVIVNTFSREHNDFRADGMNLPSISYKFHLLNILIHADRRSVKCPKIWPFTRLQISPIETHLLKQFGVYCVAWATTVF